MKTDKFNKMISAFQCDLSLAKDPSYRLVRLDRKIKKNKIALDNKIIPYWLLLVGYYFYSKK